MYTATWCDMVKLWTHVIKPQLISLVEMNTYIYFTLFDVEKCNTEAETHKIGFRWDIPIYPRTIYAAEFLVTVLVYEFPNAHDFLIYYLQKPSGMAAIQTSFIEILGRVGSDCTFEKVTHAFSSAISDEIASSLLLLIVLLPTVLPQTLSLHFIDLKSGSRPRNKPWGTLIISFLSHSFTDLSFSTTQQHVKQLLFHSSND